MVKVVWTEIATDDLKDIFDYIADDSERYASITVNKIYQRVQELIINPYLGRKVPEFNSDLIREVISGNYRIVYQIVSNNQIDILRIYHTARLLKKSSIK